MVASNHQPADPELEVGTRADAPSTLFARLAAGAWLVGAIFLGIVTVMWPPSVLVTLPWAATMLVLGLRFASGEVSRTWLIASALFAAASLVPYWLDPQGPGAYPFVVALVVAGLASILSLAVRRATDG